jgi:hypothetical protein
MLNCINKRQGTGTAVQSIPNCASIIFFLVNLTSAFFWMCLSIKQGIACWMEVSIILAELEQAEEFSYIYRWLNMGTSYAN